MAFCHFLCSTLCPLFSGPPSPPLCISSSSSLVFCLGPPFSSLSYDAILSPPLHMAKLLNLSLLNLLSISSRSHLVSTSSLGTPSWHLTPAMYLNILLSVVPIISCNPTVKGHVSEPHNRTGLMHASYTLARCLKGTQQLTKRLDISFHFSQDAEILPLTATSTPPSHSNSSPRYLKLSTSSSLSPPLTLCSYLLSPGHPHLCPLDRQSLSLQSLFSVQSISCGVLSPKNGNHFWIL